MTENPHVQIYPNKIKNRNVFNIKTGYKLTFLSPEAMKLLGSAKKYLDKDRGRENLPKLESAEVVLLHCKKRLSNTSKFLFTFLPNKQIGKLINISSHSLTMINTVNTEVSFVEVSFTCQASKALEIEDNVNLTLIIG